MSKHLRPFLGILALIFLLSLATSENTSANSTKLSIKIIPALKTSVSYTPITIEADGNLDISDIDLRVSSNNRAGFKTYMSTTHESSEENATSLAFEDIDKIETLSEDNLAAENFTMNRWGYSIDDGATFSSIHAKDSAPSEVLAATKASDDGNKIIRVGVKANTEKASGRYINTLLFTTIPNYVPPTLNDITYMQEATPEICTNTPTPSASDGENTPQYQLKDSRDGKIYWVAKLADGNCWMTQNLDLDLDSSVALTPEDSDVARDWTPSSTTIAGAANLNTTNWENNNNNPYSFDPGNYYFDGTYYSSATCNYLTTTCDHFATTPYTLNGEHGHVGNYYNWSTAVASNDTNATTVAGTDINTSICPKGWRLPHGSDSTSGNDFATLNTAYGGATNSDSAILTNPLFFVRGGYVFSGSLSNSAGGGYYWSSTANSATNADDFYFHSSFVYTSVNRNRYLGFSVRCLMRDSLPPDLNDITYMQEMTPEIAGRTPENTSKQLIDSRDGKSYWVTKLADGNIWMTQNLDLDLNTTTTLTPEDSDVTANWTPSRATIAGAANISSYTNDNNTPYSFDPGNYYFDGTYYSSSASCNYLTTTCDHFATTPYDLNGEHGHVGNYYNWSAAVASNNTSATTVKGTDMSTSICPKGWRLPHGYESTQGDDFGTLNTVYGGATNSDPVLLANPLFFVRGGCMYSGRLDGPVYYGLYWSSTTYSATIADDFLFASGGVFTSDYGDRYYGFNVRCLAR